jgi:putative transposase
LKGKIYPFNRRLTKEILDDLETIFTQLCESQKCQLISFNGGSDHCHLLVELDPDVAPSRLVNTLKTVSSRLIRRDYQEHLSKFYCKPVLASDPASPKGAKERASFWTGTYCIISTGVAPLEVIKKYIESQDAPT